MKNRAGSLSTETVVVIFIAVAVALFAGAASLGILETGAEAATGCTPLDNLIAELTPDTVEPCIQAE